MKMSEKFQVLIIEDDFRIADIHHQFVEKMGDFIVLEKVKTGNEALTYLQNTESMPDLILLDIYIPDVEGLDLLWELRTTFHHIDIMIVTAANDVEKVEESLRAGVFDYIIKPVDVARFEETLKRYKQQRQWIASKEVMEQRDIDFIRRGDALAPSTDNSNHNLPKGIDPLTLNEITSLLKNNEVQGVTAVELSKLIGTSRSTARRYLEYLVSVEKIRTTLKYGSVGRPERKYVLK
ncbi:MAG TPA: response regulator [Virgibacillus sp.]|nr:response regulator [Virgibacillus sp.]HLR69249.1 response regulator [Virgibacillus sp.]